MDLGLMVEGFVDLDPISRRMVLRIPHADGSDQLLDVQAELEKYKGTEIRLICTPLEAIAKLAKMVEAGEISV